MPDARDFQLSPQVAAKWHALTVKRRDYLAQLYQSGRWRRYFDEETFVALMREAVQSVERWAALARIGEAGPDNVADLHPAAPTKADSETPTQAPPIAATAEAAEAADEPADTALPQVAAA